MVERIVTLLTDFGLEDHYVAVMKGIIYSVCRRVTVVDITHNIPKFNVKVASAVLYFAYKYFPRGTVHSVTVYPEVGGGTRALIVETENYTFVGPNNGVLSLAAQDDGVRKVYEVVNRDYMRGESSTFHGRDIFAPVPAFLACGVGPEEIGVPVDSYLTLTLEAPRVEEECAVGEVIHVDSYGNVITSIGEEQLRALGASAGDLLSVSIGNVERKLSLVETFSGLREGELGLVIDSEGLLELCVYRGSAADKLSARAGDTVRMRRAQ